MRNREKETELNQLSGVELLSLDITDPQQINNVAEKVVVTGGVDVVFNNAGYGLAGPLEGLTDQQILRMVNTNLLGARSESQKPLFRISERRGPGCSLIRHQSVDWSQSLSTRSTMLRSGRWKAGAKAWHLS